MFVNNNVSPTIAIFYAKLYGGAGGGGSGGCVIQINDPVPETHGGLTAGTVISGQTACQVLQTILFPYQAPVFTSFYIQSQQQTLEVGQPVTGGVRTFKWSLSHPENVQANSIRIIDVTGGNTVLGQNLANDGTDDLDIGSDKSSTAINSSYTWRIIATNTKGTDFYRDYRVIWRARVYWGYNTSETLTESQVKSLQNSQLKPGYSGAYHFTNPGSDVYYFIVYPDSWGDVSEWVDTDTGFFVDYTYVGTVDVTNNYGVTITYRMLRTTYQQAEGLNSSVS